MSTQPIPAVARTVALFISVALGAAPIAAAQRSGKEIRLPNADSGDSTPPYPQLTLGEVVERALAVSPLVASGTGGVEVARSYKRTTMGAYIPSLVATSAATRIGPASASTAGGSSGGGQSTSQTVGLAAAVDIFTGGRREANEAVARADIRAAGSALVFAKYQTRLIAQQGFFAVVRAAELVRVARAGSAEASQLLRYTSDMFRAGTLTKSDFLRAQLQATTMDEQLLAANDTLVATSYALGWIAGVDGPVAARDDSATEAIRPLALYDSTIIRLAAESSPAVTLADATAAATNAAVRAARSEYTPTLTATAGRNWAMTSTVVSGAPRPGWTVTVGTSYPLFTGFQREDAVTRAQVSAYVARVTLADARRSTRAGAAELLTTLRTTESAIGLGVEGVRSAREDLRVQTLRYRAGISTMLDVLTSEAALLQAEHSLTTARHRYHTTRAAIEALVGRDL
jgi:outer membrane protein TolC